MLMDLLNLWVSRLYQKNKIDEQGISDQITDKTCLCMGLAAAAVINYEVNTRESKGVSICPGPNMAYFSDFYLTAKGYAFAACLLFGFPFLIAYRISLRK